MPKIFRTWLGKFGGFFGFRKKAGLPLEQKTDSKKLGRNSGNRNRTPKAGTRAERIRDHELRLAAAKSSIALDRRATPVQARARPSKKEFNASLQFLNELKERNPTAADRFTKLLSAGKLSRRGFEKMSINGRLARRVFLKVVFESDFEERFGPERIDGLARGLASIGPKGVNATVLKNYFKSHNESGSEIVEFLSKHGFLELHTGNHVYYLARNHGE